MMLGTDYFKNLIGFPQYSPQNHIKEAYLYSRHLDDIGLFSNTNDAKIRVLPGIFNYLRVYDPKRNSAYTMTEEVAKAFMEDATKPQKESQLEDFTKSEIELSENNINLILGEIQGRERLRNDNMKSLYDDLFRVYNWRNCRTFPMDTATDNIWLDMNKMELDLRDKIRRELKDSVRDTSFPQKDLRESLLEFKTKNTESQSLGDLTDDLEGVLETELDKSNADISNIVGDKTGAYKT